jgi:hypothetical protein
MGVIEGKGMLREREWGSGLLEGEKERPLQGA